jgi:hypothetical protein
MTASSMEGRVKGRNGCELVSVMGGTGANAIAKC